MSRSSVFEDCEEEEEEDDDELQPHLNVALRQELLYFSRIGVLRSLIRFRRMKRRTHEQLTNVDAEEGATDAPVSFTFEDAATSSSSETRRLLGDDGSIRSWWNHSDRSSTTAASGDSGGDVGQSHLPRSFSVRFTDFTEIRSLRFATRPTFRIVPT